MEEGSLRKTQKEELFMLKIFDKFCKEKKIKYSLGFGTLLGAVRHQGFIPWDDDIDLIMTGEEYEKLLFLSEDLPKEIKIKTIQNSNFTEPMVCMAKFFRRFDKDDKESPPFIDIFVFRKISSNKIIQNLEKVIHFFIRYSGGLQNDTTIFKSFSPVKRRILLKIIYIPRWILNKINFDNNMKRISNKFLNNPAQKNFCMYWSSFLVLSPKEIYPLKKLKFEGSFFPVLRNYHKFLKVTYGDYMKLPPKSERVPHH